MTYAKDGCTGPVPLYPGLPSIMPVLGRVSMPLQCLREEIRTLKNQVAQLMGLLPGTPLATIVTQTDSTATPNAVSHAQSYSSAARAPDEKPAVSSPN